MMGSRLEPIALTDLIRDFAVCGNGGAEVRPDFASAICSTEAPRSIPPLLP